MADVKTQVWYSTVLVPINCGSCGIPFGLPENLHRARINDHGSFYCPNGHFISYSGPSKTERELADVRSRVVELQRDADHQRAMRRAAALVQLVEAMRQRHPDSLELKCAARDLADFSTALAPAPGAERAA